MWSDRTIDSASPRPAPSGERASDRGKWPGPASISAERALEWADLEHGVDVAVVLAAGRCRAADEVEHFAVLQAIVRQALDPAVPVEIDGDHPLVGDVLRHEADGALRTLGDVV